MSKNKVRDINGKVKPSYKIWKSMLTRCKKGGATVTQDWLNYSNYESWYNDNFIEGYEIDKDIKCAKYLTKYYSPETCMFVPKELNLLFICCHRTNVKPCYFNEGSWLSRTTFNSKVYYFGRFDKKEDAINAYLKNYELLYNEAVDSILKENPVPSETEFSVREAIKWITIRRKRHFMNNVGE